MKPTQSNPGVKNIYTCGTCGGHIVTQDLTDGVTPFMINCQATVGCSGRMTSSMYRVFDPQDKLRPSHEWYTPSAAEIVKPHLMDHVSRGGLLLRSVNHRNHTSNRIVRHKGRGTTYRVIGEGKMQSSRWFYKAAGIDIHVDNSDVTIYEAEDGTRWVRPTEEFEDSRFEDV